MKRPIFLVDENPTISAAFTRLNEFKHKQKEVMKKIEVEHEEQRKICWDVVETELVILGKIPDRNQSLRYCDGVIYLRDEEEDKKSSLAELFKKAISSFAD